MCPSCGFTAPSQSSSGSGRPPGAAPTGSHASQPAYGHGSHPSGVHYTPAPPGTSPPYDPQQGHYPQQGYPPQHGYGQAPTPVKTSGMAVASLVFGLIAICTSFIIWIPFVGWISFGPAVLAVIFGGIAISQCSKDASLGGRGMAVAGLVLGIIVGVFGLMFRVIFAGL